MLHFGDVAVEVHCTQHLLLRDVLALELSLPGQILVDGSVCHTVLMT